MPGMATVSACPHLVDHAFRAMSARPLRSYGADNLSTGPALGGAALWAADPVERHGPMHPQVTRKSVAAALAAVVVVGVLITAGLASAGTKVGQYTGCLKSGVISN